MKLPYRRFLHLAARRRAADGVTDRVGASLSGAAGAHRRPHCPRRRARYCRAPHGPVASERLGQQFVVENRPAAAGNSPPKPLSGRPLTATRSSWWGAPNAINTTLYDKLSFNFLRDIAPVASISRERIVMVVHPSFPAKTVPELIAYAKANPGKVSFGSPRQRNSPAMWPASYSR